jgi:hypothetical protein
LQLTPYGQAANTSGLSPSSARKVASWLRESTNDQSAVALCAQLLRSFAAIPEQTDPMLRKTVAKNGARCSVKPDDFESVLGMWLEGYPIVGMFGSLDYVQRSKRKPAYSEWRQGVITAAESWETELDTFTDFLEATCRRFLPWLLRACGSLAVVSQSSWAIGFNWYELAREFETANVPDEPAQELQNTGEDT